MALKMAFEKSLSHEETLVETSERYKRVDVQNV